MNSIITIPFSAPRWSWDKAIWPPAPPSGPITIPEARTVRSLPGAGFWPGLCVSLKHNSRFASFTILAKGDYPAELDIPIPFALISNDVSKDELVVMPAYWFLYNMYALARNSWKYLDRDKRTDKTQLLEFDFLAPDTRRRNDRGPRGYCSALPARPGFRHTEEPKDLR